MWNDIPPRFGKSQDPCRGNQTLELRKMTKIKLIDEGTKGQVLTYLKMYGYIDVCGKDHYKTNRGLLKDLEDNLSELLEDGEIIKLERKKSFCWASHHRKVRLPTFKLRYVYYPQKVVPWGE